MWARWVARTYINGIWADFCRRALCTGSVLGAGQRPAAPGGTVVHGAVELATANRQTPCPRAPRQLEGNCWLVLNGRGISGAGIWFLALFVAYIIYISGGEMAPARKLFSGKTVRTHLPSPAYDDCTSQDTPKLPRAVATHIALQSSCCILDRQTNAAYEMSGRKMRASVCMRGRGAASTFVVFLPAPRVFAGCLCCQLDVSATTSKSIHRLRRPQIRRDALASHSKDYRRLDRLIRRPAAPERIQCLTVQAGLPPAL